MMFTIFRACKWRFLRKFGSLTPNRFIRRKENHFLEGDAQPESERVIKIAEAVKVSAYFTKGDFNMNALVINCSPVRNGATAEIVHIVSEYFKNKFDVKNGQILLYRYHHPIGRTYRDNSRYS